MLINMDMSPLGWLLQEGVTSSDIWHLSRTHFILRPSKNLWRKLVSLADTLSESTLCEIVFTTEEDEALSDRLTSWLEDLSEFHAMSVVQRKAVICLLQKLSHHFPTPTYATALA